MAGITAGRLEARFEEVSGRVVGGQQQDVASLGGRAIGQGRAARDAGGQGEGHQGETRAGGGIEQRSEERRVGKGVDLGGRRIIKKKKKQRASKQDSARKDESNTE